MTSITSLNQLFPHRLLFYLTSIGPLSIVHCEDRWRLLICSNLNLPSLLPNSLPGVSTAAAMNALLQICAHGEMFPTPYPQLPDFNNCNRLRLKAIEGKRVNYNSFKVFCLNPCLSSPITFAWSHVFGFLAILERT